MLAGSMVSGGPWYGPRTHKVGVWCSLEGLWVLVGCRVKVWSLIWPKGSRWCSRGDCCGLGIAPVFVGSGLSVWSLEWPKDPCCECLMWLRGIMGTCGLCGEVVVFYMAWGPML